MKPAVRANTYKYYCLVVNHHITPYFKPLRLSLDKVESRHIQGYYNMLLEKGLSTNTVLKHHSNIHKALKYACALQLIAYNPSDNVMLPKYCQLLQCRAAQRIITGRSRRYLGDGYTADSLVRLSAERGMRSEMERGRFSSSGIATTANIYSHLQRKPKVEMAEKAGSILGKCGARNTHRMGRKSVPNLNVLRTVLEQNKSICNRLCDLAKIKSRIRRSFSHIRQFCGARGGT